MSENKQLTTINSGRRGLELTTLEEMYRFSQYVVASGLAPKGVDKPEAVLVALQMGAELGLTPMASLQNVAVINGRPSVWGDAQLAVCRGSGLFDEQAFDESVEGSGDETKAVCCVRRIGGGKPVVRQFGIADAKRAGLWGKAGPWQQYPKRMLQCRARSWALRDAFADVLRGFMSAEEARDMAFAVTAEPAGSRVDQLAEKLAKPTDTEAEPEPAFNPPTDEEASQVDPAVDEAEGVDGPLDDEQEYLAAHARVKSATAAELPAIMESLSDGSHSWMTEDRQSQLKERAMMTMLERLEGCTSLGQIEATMKAVGPHGTPDWLTDHQAAVVNQKSADRRIVLKSAKKGKR